MKTKRFLKFSLLTATLHLSATGKASEEAATGDCSEKLNPTPHSIRQSEHFLQNVQLLCQDLAHQLGFGASDIADIAETLARFGIEKLGLPHLAETLDEIHMSLGNSESDRTKLLFLESVIVFEANGQLPNPSTITDLYLRFQNVHQMPQKAAAALTLALVYSGRVGALDETKILSLLTELGKADSSADIEKLGQKAASIFLRRHRAAGVVAERRSFVENTLIERVR